jgi:phenylalanyl-tRNA synthetase beta chain
MLMIADGERVVALAGIMGGADSEIQGATSEVLLESAHFDSLSVRRTARRLGMHTEASHRFERGCDPEMAAVACDRAAALIAELTGGEVARGRIDVNPQPWRARAMAFRASALSSFAGLEIPVERMVEILRGLDFGPEASGDTVRVAVPPFRVDIEREADLYEEVIRHVGYGAVPAVLPVLATSPGQRNVNWELVDRAREAAVAAGLTEIITWSFVDEASDTLAAESPLCPGPAVELANPLATTQSVMRRSLLPGVLAAVGFNLNQGERRLAVFEQGRVFSRGGERPLEGERLAIAVVGGEPSRADGFLRLKGVVEQLAAEIGLGTVTWKRGGEPWLDRGFGAVLEVPENRVVGTAGLLADNASARWDLRSDVFVAELDLDQSNPPLTPRFEALPRFPSVVMDMTVEHHGELAYAELEDAVRELAGEWAESVSFVPPQFPLADGSGRVRTTLRVVYRHPERSLTQDEVNAAGERLRGELGERLQVDFA